MSLCLNFVLLSWIVQEMTLEEYEKVLEEKRKTLQALKSEIRKVELDRDFESMQLVDKKNDDEIFLKLVSWSCHRSILRKTREEPSVFPFIPRCHLCF